MEAQYIEKANGYIIDNPNIDFLRMGDGVLFSYDEVSTFTMQNTSNNITINGGQSPYPLAIIDTDRTTEITFASAQFDLNMFAMSSVMSDAEMHGDFSTVETARFDVANDLTVNIPFETKEVFVKGYTEATGDVSFASGTYKVTRVSYTSEVDPETNETVVTEPATIIQFYEGDVAADDIVRIGYKRRVNDSSRVVVKTDGTSACGELWAHWPVYSSGTDLNVRSFAA